MDEGPMLMQACVEINHVHSSEMDRAQNSNTDHQVLRNFLPVNNINIESPGFLLLVQASFFACGGLAISVSISHKISDGSAAGMFIKGWAAASLGVDYEFVSPQFNASSIFPPQNILSNLVVELIEEKCVIKRFIFLVSKIFALKDKVASESVRYPTRVEAVTTLIWKCAMNASLSNSKKPKKSVMGQAVDIKRRLGPLVSNQTMGNLTKNLYLQATTGSEIELASLVIQMRTEIQDFGEVHLKTSRRQCFRGFSESLKERSELLYGGNTDFYSFTSIYRFPFYGIDFGWGKPDWVTFPRNPVKNIIALMDATDGHRIEAWVTLTEEEMAIFECDKQLLAFACLNPTSVFDPIIPKSSR